jgi:hypothetical protein
MARRVEESSTTLLSSANAAISAYKAMLLFERGRP